MPTRQASGERCSRRGSCHVGQSENGRRELLRAGEAFAEAPRLTESGGRVSGVQVVAQLLVAGLAGFGLPWWRPVQLGHLLLPALHREPSTQDQARDRQTETAVQRWGDRPLAP